jgi:predicted phage terminase large subunit-like protein
VNVAPALIPTLDQVRAEKSRRSLASFVRYGWPILEPGTPLAWNWHIDAICLHLEAVTRGDIRRLLINIPPGHMKSLIVSVFWPAWEWLAEPEERSLMSSYSMDLASRDSVRCRDLITSDWYQEWFQPEWFLKGDQNVKSYFENSRKGFRFSLSVGGRATGFRGGKVVVDDPLNAKEQHSIPAREECTFWWDKVMSSRLNDQRKGKRVIIMQRLHSDDLSGHVIAKKLGYDHLCLPSEYESRPEACECETCQKGGVTGIGWRDPRTERGDLLFPEMFPPEVIAEAKRDLGSSDYAGQHQQRPSPTEGGILKRHWFRFWIPKDLEGSVAPVRTRMPDNSWYEHPLVVIRPLNEMDELAQSWDMAFKDTLESDFVAGQVWARKGADKFLMDQVHGRMDFTVTCTAVENLSAAWPKANAKLVEDKANGTAVIATLRSKVPGLIAIEPEGGKVARTHAAAPEIESGNVYLPHPAIAPWVEAFLTECTTFPNASHDDQVDAMTQMLARWKKRGDDDYWDVL